MRAEGVLPVAFLSAMLLAFSNAPASVAQEKETGPPEVLEMPDEVSRALGQLHAVAGDDSAEAVYIGELASMGSRAVPAIPHLLEFVRRYRDRAVGVDARNVWGTPAGVVADALPRFGTDAVPEIAKALKDDNALVRWVAAEALRRMGPGAKDAIPALVEAVRGEGRWPPDAKLGLPVNIAAAQALREIGPPAVPALIQLLKDDDRTARYNALSEIPYLGPAAKDAIPVLVEILGSGPDVHREAAAWALGSIGPDAKAAIPALTKALSDTDRSVRDAAERALKQIRER